MPNDVSTGFDTERLFFVFEFNTFIYKQNFYSIVTNMEANPICNLLLG